MALDVPGSQHLPCAPDLVRVVTVLSIPPRKYLQYWHFSQLLDPILSGLPGHSVMVILHSVSEQFSLLHSLKAAPRQEGTLAPSQIPNQYLCPGFRDGSAGAWTAGMSVASTAAPSDFPSLRQGEGGLPTSWGAVFPQHPACLLPYPHPVWVVHS